ncbi:HalOD1 output domain-containing protein [Halobacterium zhouii]|uniref:HalOD1 output domain-containing protein n=1 Tax=Halobacterium zhouii TaxID=2902624 RepID=UPI001E425890|nr:HalOD1 output domain-containing protein [Halobacterium zhouii]
MTVDQADLNSESEPSHFTWSADRTVSEQVVQAVADVADTSVTEIEPLNDAVDADALNNLFSAKFDGSVRRGGYLAFEYANHFVTVFASGRIEVDESV